MIYSVGFTNEEVVFILLFYTLGGILGYFAFRHKSCAVLPTIGNCLLTTGIGVFLAYIFANYLQEHSIFSRSMNMLIGGLGSFGFPDIVINAFPSVKEIIINLIVAKYNTRPKEEVK